MHKTIVEIAVHESSFSQKLLKWFDEKGRKDLPWQQDRTPYRVWVSEVMLQQTQVNSVIPYFTKFMSQFPDVHTLASTIEDEVLHFWSGLGYYSRARNLYKTARILVTEFSGQFPSSIDQLMQLPGIGRSTAGAIVSISMGIRAPILDGNVKRVLSRYCAVDGWPGQTSVAKKLWDIAEQFTPTARVDDYSQVIMDIGATICTRTKPQCHRCPLQTDCKGHLTGTEKLYPKSKPKKEKPHKTVYMFMMIDQFGQVVLLKRPPSGIWPGLWSFPETPLTNDHLQTTIDATMPILLSVAKQITGLKPKTCDLWPALHHAFSHYNLTIMPVLSTIERPLLKKEINAHHTFNIEKSPCVWLPLDKFDEVEIGLPAPVKKLLIQIQKAI